MSANHSETINNNNNKMATTTISTTNIIQMTVNDNDYNSHFEGNLLDISADPEAYYRVVLFGYITPIFFLITLAANILIVLVLSRPTMRSPTNLVLLSMAVADLLTLIFPVPWYFYMYTLGYYKFLLYPALSCNLYHVMSEILPTFFHTASIWCTLLLACQRYVYICHPTLAKVWCTNQRVTRTILAIFLLASVHQLLRFFEGHWIDAIVMISSSSQPPPSSSPPPSLSSSSHKSIFNDGDVGIMPTIMDDNSIIMNTNNESMINNEPQKACRQVIAKWTTSIENLYFGTYFVFRIVFVHIGPCFLLVIFNVLLYNALKRAEKTRNKLLNKQQSTEQRNGSSGWNKQQQQQQQSDDHQQQRKANRGRDANSTTVMLIVVVTVFLIVEIPLAVATAIHVTENMFTVDIVSDRFLSMTIIFSNFFIIISYPLNFAIYCGMSRAFRETFQQMFLKNLFTIRLTARSSSLNPFVSTATTTSTTTNTTTTTTTLSSSNTATATTLTRMKNISSASSKTIINNTIALQSKPSTISRIDGSKKSNMNIISLSTTKTNPNNNNSNNDSESQTTLKSYPYNDNSNELIDTNRIMITINSKNGNNQLIKNKIDTNSDNNNNNQNEDDNDDRPKETMV
ncbi:hypothetical protein DERF_002133 [Dermatophagoides farinae]|uniref:G-protein coupled receptors family 1 profile domain-containing protein n=1 Tax=Dermatophagoides farinae TaxID=6954 RepID=A0A922IF54_DERFA|nr:hypothetical protein DERF_002133 [Dermatophagoides farinae]